MSKLLEETLSAIQTERRGEFDRSFDLVDDLLAEYGENNLAERLYQEISPKWHWEVIADLFAILIWSTSDNGCYALTTVTDQWLQEGDDIRKIQIALHLDIFPFLYPDQMSNVLTNIAERYPEVAAQCEELIGSRNKIRG